ncbi:Pseudouridylate synthase-like protein [Streptobacillus moniliformis]|uniref:Pseudouridylate synthase-like protein n=1 Tax=Streptobacillus moniliformis (strain ATCC 14647 / DSM 12112 / NCTC 10651 / 9901) TaxID=519441 RepID=D1AXK4_STRM9|nr:Pseudouridylate synthase-like protein [Streptobacillus moniliformis]ACZ01030.1 Pseudouridylate synthase-like protein [Streptobacillus moniliformis DSM 12112]AVL42600.1 pseudouridylate synthase [Streptobacillus moniliformis]QXW65812.1 pseudouridylate synthase [Streptobacillus moniliformis]SQA13831.1 tRNA pseudouridine synthase A [Streptobacillus moniliformis]SQA14862.1 tRNA pseudouridine synthase A [Streptobacillus moniliformis]
MKNTKKGYLLEISYKGKKFDCFDEIKDKKTVKGVLKEYILSKGIKIYKGLQQAGRTDARVSAYSNYIYFVADRFNIDILDINVDISGLKIKNIIETKNDIVLPDIVEKRIYIYFYPKKFLNVDKETILKRCEEISGYRDFSEFTNHKGLKLKNHFRDVKVTYVEEKLYFEGNSFMPQQVRIMSGYILKGKKEAMDPKFLVLEKIIFKGDVL